MFYVYKNIIKSKSVLDFLKILLDLYPQIFALLVSPLYDVFILSRFLSEDILDLVGDTADDLLVEYFLKVRQILILVQGRISSLGYAIDDQEVVICISVVKVGSGSALKKIISESGLASYLPLTPALNSLFTN